MAYLKKKDSCIYDEDIKFFNNSSGTTEHTESENKIGRKLKKEKVFLHNYEHKFEIDRNGQFSNNEDEDNTKEKITIHCQVGEEEEIKNPFKHVKEESEDTDNEDNELVIQTKEDRELEVILITFSLFYAINYRNNLVFKIYHTNVIVFSV